jgi:hypothetical protein
VSQSAPDAVCRQRLAMPLQSWWAAASEHLVPRLVDRWELVDHKQPHSAVVTLNNGLMQLGAGVGGGGG